MSDQIASELGGTDQASDEAEPAAEIAEPTTSPVEAVDEPSPKPSFSVADGRTVYCLKGAVHAGHAIRAMDLAGGEDALADLVANGDVIVDRPEA